MAGTTEGEWVGRFADEVIAEAETHRPGEPIICASGLSPSGPIHLGNLREVMTPHLVADEIRRRGHAVEHLVSWDDYDRFRKVPAGVDPSWEQHIGKPLTSVPAPHGSSHRNWAEHFKATIVDSLRELGVEFRGISQTQMYTSGAYRDLILLAMRKRETIDAILAQYRTKTVHVDAPDANPVVPAEGGHPDTGASAYGGASSNGAGSCAKPVCRPSSPGSPGPDCPSSRTSRWSGSRHAALRCGDTSRHGVTLSM